MQFKYPKITLSLITLIVRQQGSTASGMQIGNSTPKSQLLWLSQVYASKKHHSHTIKQY
jgi:hypothetical protein